MEGAYSQIGDVLPLVSENDNALAIIGAGEGVELKFKDNLPKLNDGFQRHFILKFKGWAKDMDIMTRDGDTLEPLPFNDEVSKEAHKLNQDYNTRFQAGR